MAFISPAGAGAFTTANATTSLTVSRPASGVLGGHRLLMFVGGVNTAGGDITFASTGWTLVPGATMLDSDSTGVRTKLEVYEKIATGTAGAATTEAVSYTVTATGITGKYGAVILNYGNDTGAIAVGTAKGAGASSTARSVAVTFTGSPRIIITAFADAGGTHIFNEDTERAEVTSASSGLAVADSTSGVPADTLTRTATSTLSTSVWSGIALAVTITPTPQPPVITVADDISNAEPGATYTTSATATDSDGTIASYAVSAPGLTLSGTGSSRTFSIPLSLTPQTYTITWTVTDNSGLTDTGTQTITALACSRRIAQGGAWIPAVRNVIL